MGGEGKREGRRGEEGFRHMWRPVKRNTLPVKSPGLWNTGMTVYSFGGIWSQAKHVRASMRTSRVSRHDVAIHCFIKTWNIFTHCDHIIYFAFLPLISNNDIAIEAWRTCANWTSGFTKHSTKRLKKLYKTKCLIFMCIDLCPSNRSYNGRSNKKGKRHVK